MLDQHSPQVRVAGLRRQGVQPTIQGVVLGQGEHLASQGPGHRFAAAKVFAVQQAANISAGPIRTVVRRMLKKVQGGNVRLSAEQAGP